MGNIRLYHTDSDNRNLDKKLTLIKEISIEIKDKNNILTPSIYLHIFENWENVNYIYVEEFSRYYYVTITTRPAQMILLECKVDVLMSYSAQIKQLICIIDKQESKSDVYSDVYLDDGNFVTECRTFNTIINFPNGFQDNPEYILITAGRIGD